MEIGDKQVAFQRCNGMIWNGWKAFGGGEARLHNAGVWSKTKVSGVRAYFREEIIRFIGGWRVIGEGPWIEAVKNRRRARFDVSSTRQLRFRDRNECREIEHYKQLVGRDAC